MPKHTFSFSAHGQSISREVKNMATRHLQEKFDYRGVTVIPLLTHKTWQEPNGFGVPIQFFDIVEKGGL